jgi:hypothetical protein
MGAHFEDDGDDDIIVGEVQDENKDTLTDND